jgi:hypothetical protein
MRRTDTCAITDTVMYYSVLCKKPTAKTSYFLDFGGDSKALIVYDKPVLKPHIFANVFERIENWETSRRGQSRLPFIRRAKIS